MALILYLLGATFMTLVSFRIAREFPNWQHYFVGLIWPFVVVLIIFDNIFDMNIMGDGK
mgnify:CR=1 FL=1